MLQAVAGRAICPAGFTTPTHPLSDLNVTLHRNPICCQAEGGRGQRLQTMALSAATSEGISRVGWYHSNLHGILFLSGTWHVDLGDIKGRALYNRSRQPPSHPLSSFCLFIEGHEELQMGLP